MGCKKYSSTAKIVYLTKKAIRIITNSHRCAHDTHPLFRRLSILKIEELHKLQVACFMYKICKGLLPPYFSAMFCLNETIHLYATRHANDYHITVHRTSLLKKKLSYRREAARCLVLLSTLVSR